MEQFEFSEIWKPFREDTTKYRDVLKFHPDYQTLLYNTETLAYLVRSLSVYQMTCAALGHPGGSFSFSKLIRLITPQM